MDAIYWNRVDDQGNLEIVVSRLLSEGDPTGVGLDSGDFNITANNSLVINYMRLEYEQPYVCTVLDTSLADDSSTTEVIATGKCTLLMYKVIHDEPFALKPCFSAMSCFNASATSTRTHP